MSEPRVFLDPNKMMFIDAPLTTLNENAIKEYNAAFLRNKGAGANAAIPHFYNKVSFLTENDNTADTELGGIIGDNNAFSPSGFSSRFTSQGYVGSVIYRPFNYPNMQDWVIYYEIDKLSNKSWSNIGTNPNIYDNIVFLMTGFYFVQNTPSASMPVYTPQKDMGVFRFRVQAPEGVTPTPTTNYNDWYYIKTFKIYNRAANATSNRTELKNTFPCVLWDLQNLYLYQGHKAKTIVGNFQSLTRFSPNIESYQTGVSTFWQLFDWAFVNTTRTSPTLGGDDPLPDANAGGIYHKSQLGDNIKLIAAQYPNTTMVQKIVRQVYGEEKVAWWDSTPTYNLVALPVFKTEDDFLKLLGDWGLSRATNDLELAKSQPAELFPDYKPEGGFVPDGGKSEGYDDNPIIPNVPSYPDNTSDGIDVVTPNVSSANAANVYALTLTATQNFLKWLMTDSFIDNISNLFSDKLSALNDLKILPFDVVAHDTNHTAASSQLTLANVSTDIPCYRVQAGYNCILDGGNYHYTAYWGNYNDYTAASYYLYIPYGGIVELSPSHVVNCDLSIKYAVDLMTGNATAVIYSNGVLVKTVPCQMSQPVPITFTNTNQRDIKNALTALSVVNNIGGAIASGAAGNVAGAVSGGLGAIGGIFGGIANNPLKVGSIGNFSSSTAFAMPQNAFLIITRAQLSMPSGLAGIAGRPSNIYTTINSFVGSGFVQINVSHINTAATMDEQNQILELLRGGIFI